jgi:UDP-N-acetylmuramoylalanine--D-glutamate ligase
MTEQNKNIVILGAAESGVGAALLAASKGFQVFVSDTGSIQEVFKNKLLENKIAFEEGKHTSEKILSASEIIKSPGIPDKAEIIKAAKKAKIPVISEIEFAGRYTKAKIIGITGTNGKTTTTLLTFHLLKKAGLRVGLAGNIGNSFAELVVKDEFDFYVLELSSFQLDGIKDLKIDIGVITNITPDHLDRYEYKIENYVASKFRIIRNMDRSCTFIYGEDSELIQDALFDVDTDAQELPFSLEESEGVAAWGNLNRITLDPHFDISHDGHQESNLLSVDLTKSVLKGRHNVYNTMAAALVAAKLGISARVIEDGLQDFQNAPHRMELAGVWDGVTFINDSKATNVDSAWYALDAIKNPIVWIAGGVDKGNNYSDLYKVIEGKVKALVCLGVENEKLINAFKGKIPVIQESKNVRECLQLCKDLAKKGDVVLLSPCCASFDLFKNYEDRGNKFKEELKKLIQAN